MKGKLFWIGGVLVLLLAVGVTSAIAQNTVTYYACVNNSSGTIRMRREGKSCKNNETLIDWNQRGPAGPPGPQGEPGVIGFYKSYAQVYVDNDDPGAHVVAYCSPGDQVTGGGFGVSPTLVTYRSKPTQDKEKRWGWLVDVDNPNSARGYVDAHAICADMTP